MRLDADQLGRTTAESRPRRRACPLVGAAALRVADLGKARKTPAGCPQQASPAGNRLVRGSPGRVWARTSPCIGGLFLVSAVIPQRPICSNPTHDDGRPYHATPGIHTAHGMLCSAIGLPAAHSEGQSHDGAREQRSHLRPPTSPSRAWPHSCCRRCRPSGVVLLPSERAGGLCRKNAGISGSSSGESKRRGR
jgi:hypothetical protein